MNSTSTRQALNKTTEPDSYVKGRLFETYVKNLFNEKNFKLKRWRKSALLSPDTYIRDLCYPDLELIFVRRNHYPFAVECKYKSNFRADATILWASQKKIAIYEAFEKKFNMTVFIAIGIGGSPSNPQKLFLTPLANIKDYPNVSEQQLIKYFRKTDRRFFFDTVNKKLK
jgi:hypothetical protein